MRQLCLTLDRLSEAEVPDMRLAVGIDEDVGGLEIRMRFKATMRLRLTCRAL